MKFIIAGLEIYNENNIRGHWAQECARGKKQKNHVSAVLKGHIKPAIAVVLTRCSPRELDQGNLANAFKYVQDTVAKELRLDDACKAIYWDYRWKKSKDPEVWIEIQSYTDFMETQMKEHVRSLLRDESTHRVLEFMHHQLAEILEHKATK